MEIGYFHDHSTKLLKVFQANVFEDFITTFYSRSVIISVKIHFFCYFVVHLYFCLYYFYYAFIKQFIRLTLFRIPLCLITYIYYKFKSNIIKCHSFLFILFTLYHIHIMTLSGDIELNPGPTPSSCKKFLNISLKFKKYFVSWLQPIMPFKVLMLLACLNWTSIRKTFSSDDNASMPAYNMSLADHPSNNRHRGISIYFKKSLHIKVLIMYYLQECIFFDQQIGNKICKIISLYRSPTQTASEFDKCLTFLSLPLKSITQINLFL